MKNGWATSSYIIAIILLIGGIVGAIVLGTETEWYFALFVIFGAVASFCLFGTLGYIAEKVGILTSDSQKVMVKETEEEAEDEAERQAKLKKLYDQGSLTEEEYKKALFEEPGETAGNIKNVRFMGETKD